MYLAQFWLLCAGMTVMGMYTAFGKYYRFAAADAAPVEFRAKAISLTLAGGIVGGIFGPEMAKRTVSMVDGHTYLGPYLSLVFVCLLATILLTRLDIPMLSAHEREDSGRPLSEIMSQPVFIVAALASMLSYGIMNLIMTSTPLAMRAHDHPFNDAAFVLQWHMIGMYGPSFFTGSLIQRFGVLNIILTGIALLLVCIVAALERHGATQFLGCALSAGHRMELHVRRRIGAADRSAHAGRAREDTGRQRLHGVFDDGDLVDVFRRAAQQERLARRELRLDPVSRARRGCDALADVAPGGSPRQRLVLGASPFPFWFFGFWPGL